jgi:hypothetical protein
MNLAPYAKLRDGNDLESMDERHVQMIYSVLCSEGSPQSKLNVVNIGIANGYSSIATLQAAREGIIDYARFVDVSIRECFRRLITSDISTYCLPLEKNSRDLDCQADVWIIDGDHQKGAVDDYNKARTNGAKIIIAHDTCETWCPAQQWGAIEIGRLMRNDATLFFEDWSDRQGEMTKRGLTIAFYYAPPATTIDKLILLAK